MKIINSMICKQFSQAIAAAALLGLTLGMPAAADAAVFAKFDGVDGESKDSDHKGWIDVLSIDWGVHQPGGGATGQSRRRGSVVVEDMRLTIDYEKASPKLLEKCLMGEVIPKLEIEFTREFGDARSVYLKYELKNVMITSTKFHHEEKRSASAAEPVPSEDFSLNFEEIKVTYTEYDAEGKVTVQVPTIADRHYRLKGSFDLAGDRWIGLDEFETGADFEPGLMEFVMPPGAASQIGRLFFKVEVSVPGEPGIPVEPSLPGGFLANHPQ